MEYLYKFSGGSGHYGSIEGIFVANKEDIEKIIGKEVYFGEVLGKHSEVSIEIVESNFTILSEDKDFIEQYKTIVGDFGYNPFDYEHLEDEDEDEDLGEEDE